MKNTHPNIERLETLLNANPNWAVKITAPDFDNAIMKLPFKGEDKIWIHAYMVGGDFQQHITDLARSKNLSKMDFEIKKSKGSAYVKIPLSQLDQPKFSITIEPMNTAQTAPAATGDQATLVEQLLQALKGSQQKDPGLGSPETAKVGLSMPEFIQNTKNEWDLEHLQRENAELKAKLDKKSKKLKQYEAEKPKFQERLMNFAESNPEIAGRIFEVIQSGLDKVISPKAGLAKPELPEAPAYSDSLKQLIGFLQGENSERLNGKIYLLAYWYQYNDTFGPALDNLIKEYTPVNQNETVNEGGN